MVLFRICGGKTVNHKNPTICCFFCAGGTCFFVLFLYYVLGSVFVLHCLLCFECFPLLCFNLLLLFCLLCFTLLCFVLFYFALFCFVFCLFVYLCLCLFVFWFVLQPLLWPLSVLSMVSFVVFLV